MLLVYAYFKLLSNFYISILLYFCYDLYVIALPSVISHMGNPFVSQILVCCHTCLSCGALISFKPNNPCLMTMGMST